MYDIRQFKPALYVLLFTGLCGFSLGAESGMLFVLGSVALLLNAWLVWRGWFRPLPRLVSNLVTVAALVYVIHELPALGGETVMLIGEFLMLLQMVKLWEQRGNRDYGQLLVLSLLLMVAAAISTRSVLFGALMLVYLFISLYCCLLFHLKVESDAAKLAMAAPERKISPAALRQDQRHFAQSMRKLTAMVSLVAMLCAVVVFILFPRGTGANMLGAGQFKPTQSMVGFSDEVSFQNFAKIQQNETIVAFVALKHNGQAVRGGTLLLRGVTLDRYTGEKEGYRWVRWPRTGAPDPPRNRPRPRPDFDDPASDFTMTEKIAAGEVKVLTSAPPPDDAWQQEITLLPTGTSVMFAMAGPYSIQPAAELVYRFSRRDGELRSDNSDRDRRAGEIKYTVISSNDLGIAPPPVGSGTPDARLRYPEIVEYMRQHNVAGSDANGSLALQRAKHGDLPRKADELDEQIAKNIESYLKDARNGFRYSLDLSTIPRTDGRDPVVAFVCETHKDDNGVDIHEGNCEYYAGAMTLMCQSLGVKARMCLGFRCTEYNGTPGAGYYIVRQSHAHAWVEVFTKEGWKTFDPTAEEDSKKQAEQQGFLQTIKHFFNFLQFAYGNSIIAFNNDDRSNLMQRTESAMAGGARSDRLRNFHLGQLWPFAKSGAIASALNVASVSALAVVALALIVRALRKNWLLRGRAARIGISTLPRDEQLRLARQLEFYGNLLGLLESHQIRRTASQTPLEFSKSLLFLPAGIYEGVRRLTELFYRVRYGHAELTAARQRHLGKVIEKLGLRLREMRGA